MSFQLKDRVIVVAQVSLNFLETGEVVEIPPNTFNSSPFYGVRLDMNGCVYYYGESELELENEHFKKQLDVSDSMLMFKYPSDSEICSHDWKHHQGLIEQFDYCSKCDEKRNKK